MEKYAYELVGKVGDEMRCEGPKVSREALLHLLLQFYIVCLQLEQVEQLRFWF